MTKKHWFLLIVIIIIASFMRLYQIMSVPPGLYPDEAMNGNNALEALRTHNWKVFYPENNGREGLFINVQALFLKFFGANEPWVLRLPAALFGIFTVLGIYFLAAELFSTETGLLAAFFLATSFWHINFSRIGFRAIMAPLLLTWAIYFLLRAFRSRNSIFYFLFSIFSGIVYGLGFYTYIAYRVSPLLILLILVYFWFKSKSEGWRRNFLLSAFCFLFSVFSVALPIGIYFLQHQADFFGRTSEISIFASASPLKAIALNTIKTIGMFNFIGDWNWRHNIAGSPELYWPVGILFLTGFALAIKDMIENVKFKIKNSSAMRNAEIFHFSFSILISWFILALLPVVVSNEGIPHALRSILLLPPTIILSASGGIWLWRKLSLLVEKKLLLLASCFLLAALVFTTYVNYFGVWAPNNNVYGAFSGDYVELGRKLNGFPAEVPKYVVVETTGVDVRGIPMPAQTVMFITDTFSPENQKAKNIHYVLPENEGKIPAGALKFYIP